MSRTAAFVHHQSAKQRARPGLDNAMSTLSTLLLLSVLGTLGIVLFRLRSKTGSTPTTAKADAKSKPFAAVSIVYDDALACPEAKAYAGKRVLSADFPKLPLPNCSAESCTCSFHYFSDRRKGQRRDQATGIFDAPYEGAERRQDNDGRRAKDVATGALEQDGTPMDDTYFGHHGKTGSFRT
jgi:hypothetical protein